MAGMENRVQLGQTRSCSSFIPWVKPITGASIIVIMYSVITKRILAPRFLLICLLGMPFISMWQPS